MELKLKLNDAFSGALTEFPGEDGIRFFRLDAKAKGDAAKLDAEILWEFPSAGVNAVWTPGHFAKKDLVPDWGEMYKSCEMNHAPVLSDLGFDDTNRQTIALSDAKNGVKMHTGVIEENGNLECKVQIGVGCAVSEYSALLRIDTRPIPFYRCLDDVRAWWETMDGYAPAPVPAAARDPLYSAWYSYHQFIDVPAIIADCRKYAALGCKVLIVDDGWQTDNTARGFGYCGDWRPCPAKVPDMKAFVEGVHEAGMKYMMWFALPFVGDYSEAYQRFKDKILCRLESTHTNVVDPRYPDVREYLIGILRRAQSDWNMDGFKLDFIDSFRQSDEVKPGMDYVSVYDAVDRLMKDILSALREKDPDVLVEFRQTYVGPIMRTYGNMFRSSDCPADSLQNRLNTLAVRMICGNTAAQSDMVMWDSSASAEEAAYQLTNVLFSVPQVSVRYDRLTADQAKMVKNYLSLWTKYREVLLDGELCPRSFAANYPYVSAVKDGVQVGAVYAGRIAYLETQTDEILLFNAEPDDSVILESSFGGVYSCAVRDCMGNLLREDVADLTGGTVKIKDVPVNGTVHLLKK